MSGFSNSLSHFYDIHAIRTRYSNSYTFSNFTCLMICLRLQYLQLVNNLWWTDCQKSLPNLFAHLPLQRYPPPICGERKYVTSKPEPETWVWPLPNPKTLVYRKNPGLETLMVDGVKFPFPSPAFIQSYLYNLCLAAIIANCLEWRLKVTQGHRKWCQSSSLVQFPIYVP